MIETSTKSNNPYQVPNSNLADESDDQGDWTLTTIKWAERRERTSFCAYTSALYLSVLSTMLLDTILFGWAASLVGSVLFSTLVAYAATLAFSYPICKLTVFFQRSGKTASKFIARQLNELGKWYSKPIFSTILVLFGSVLFLFVVVYLEEFGLSIFDLDPSQLARRFSALLILPLMMPLTHILVKASQRKARKFLEKMSESS